MTTVGSQDTTGPMTADELVERITGAPPGHGALMRHLNAKYGEIYDLG